MYLKSQLPQFPLHLRLERVADFAGCGLWNHYEGLKLLIGEAQRRDLTFRKLEWTQGSMANHTVIGFAQEPSQPTGTTVDPKATKSSDKDQPRGNDFFDDPNLKPGNAKPSLPLFTFGWGLEDEMDELEMPSDASDHAAEAPDANVSDDDKDPAPPAAVPAEEVQPGTVQGPNSQPRTPATDTTLVHSALSGRPAYTLARYNGRDSKIPRLAFVTQRHALFSFMPCISTGKCQAEKKLRVLDHPSSKEHSKTIYCTGP